ncbi:hypothetical protein ABZP36_020666 [Zizania latifolia]
MMWRRSSPTGGGEMKVTVMAALSPPLRSHPGCRWVPSGSGKQVSNGIKYADNQPVIPWGPRLLTKEFINLLKQAPDGILDLNNATETLETEVENLSVKEQTLDERISDMREKLRGLTEDKNNQKWLYVTEDDIKGLPCFQNETLIAIKAPHGTTLEVPDPDEAGDYLQRRYRIVLRSTMGPIDVYLVSHFEEKFEELGGGAVGTGQCGAALAVKTAAVLIQAPIYFL